MIKAVIFDFDGVLVESVDIKTQAFAQLFKDEGPSVVGRVVGYHESHAGVSRFDKFKYIYAEILKRELTPGIFDGLCSAFSRLVLDAVIAAPYVRGAREFLERYSGRYSFYVSSATPQGEIETIVRARKMDGYFSGVYGSPTRKGEIVKRVLASGRLSPAETVYVGDALSDYEAAISNGVHFVARIRGNEPVFAGIECVRVRDLSGLKDIIGSL